MPLLLTVAAAEYLIMVVFENSGLSDNAKNIVDSLYIVAILTPFFYFMYKDDKPLALSEARYRSLFENMLDGFAYCEMLFDVQGRPVDFIYLDVNSAFGMLTGLKNVAGKKITEVIPGIKESNPELFEIYGRVALTGERERFETYSEFFGGWLSVSVYSRERGYFVAVFDNITERKLAEETAKIHARQQAAVAELGQLALMEQDLSILMGKAVALVAECLGLEYSKILELLPDGRGLLLRAGVGWKAGYVGHAIVGADTGSHEGYTLLSNEPVVVDDLRTENRFRGPALLVEHGVVSGISVVIPGKERQYGVLGAHTSRHRTFNNDDISFIKSIANVVAEAVEHNKYESAIVERNERLAMLNMINKSMTSTLDLEMVLEALMKNISRTVKAESGAFFLYDDTKDKLSMQKCHNFGTEEGQACLSIGNLPHIMDIINSKEPLVVGRVDERSDIYRDYGILSIMILPVLFMGRVQGVACLFNIKEAHEFSSEEVYFAAQVADQAMIAIMNARLVQSLKDHESELVLKNRELHALNSIAKIISGTKDQDKMLQGVLEKTLSLSFLDMQQKGAIFIRDEKDPNILSMATYAGVAPDLVEIEKQIRLGHCLCDKAALTDEIILSEDCFSDTDHTAGYPGMMSHGHVVIPIKSKDNVVGAMTFYLGPGALVSDHEGRVLTAIANQLAVAIENRRLFKHVSIAKKEWEETFDAMEELVTIHSADFTILRANRAAAKAAGVSVSEMVGRKCYDIFHGTSEPIHDCPAEKVITGGLESGVNYGINVGQFAHEISVYPLKDDGGLTGFVHIAKDITERKLSEDALRKSERQLKAILDNIPDMAWLKDKESRFIAANEPFARACGLNADELAGKTDSDIWPRYLAEGYRDDDNDVIATGKRKSVEEPFVDKDGRKLWVATIKTPIFDSNGEVVGSTGIARDITERKKAEEKIAHLNRLYSVMSDINKAIVRITKKDLLIEEACRIVVEQGRFRMAWIGMVDETSKQVVPVVHCGHEDGYLASAVISTRDIPEGCGPTGTAIRTGLPITTNDIENDPIMLLWRKEALKRNYRSSMSIPITSGPKVIGALNVYSEETNFFDSEEVELLSEVAGDISYALQHMEYEELRMSAERALKESEMKFRSLVEQSLVGVYIIEDDLFRYVNPRFAEIFGYTVEEITNIKSPRELVLPDDWPLVLENVRKREEGVIDVLHYAFRGMRKQGDVVHVEVHGSRTIYEGRPAGIGVLMDISERLSAQDELVKNAQQMVVLREAARQLEEINRLKSDFLANMSHELRTPLNAVIGLSYVLLQEKFGPVNQKQSEYLGGINQSGEHLLSLINEILDLSKIEAGKELLEPATFNIEKTLRSAFIMIKEKAFKHNIEIVSEIAPDIGTFYADERRVKQIIFNLLSNAVKFTGPGGKVGMKALRTDLGLSITVWDTGIGIRDDKKKLLFQPFQQMDSSLSRRHEGTGLGLVLTKKLVELHGGSITFESKEGAGTSFTVTLPERHFPESGAKAETSEPEAPAGTVLHMTGRRIMVVEDNRLNMVLASDFIKLNGFEVIEASDGEQALLKVSSERPDLILMDIQMPGVDGLEVTRKLKEDPSTRTIPIIAMTALAMQGDEKMCLQGGCDDYIRKPVNLDEMMAKIEKRLFAG